MHAFPLPSVKISYVLVSVWYVFVARREENIRFGLSVACFVARRVEIIRFGFILVRFLLPRVRKSDVLESL